MDSTGYKFPKLKGSINWDIWVIRMEATLIKEGYENAYKKEATGDIDITANSAKAASLIRLALEDGPLI